MKSTLVLVSLLLVAGCGMQDGADGRADTATDPGAGDVSLQAGDPPTQIPAATGPVSSALATVMDTGRPELCLGPVAESYPPQCSGIPLEGWDWSDWKGLYEQAGDTRWGSFAVTGTFDGTTFHVTGAVPAALYDAAYPEPTDFTTPCPEPDGGWRVLDPALTTSASFEEVFQRASQLDGYAGAWVDQSVKLPDVPDGVDSPDEVNDPTRSIVNVKVTGDPADAEQELRKVWGGMLCITTAQHTETELNRVAEELRELPGMLGSMGQSDRVDVQVVYDDGSLQDWVDKAYGSGLVRVDSALSP